MRVFLLALGTRGDVELFLTLARELADRGHQVTLGTSEFYSNAVRGAGAAWARVGDGTRDDLLAVLRSLAALRGGEERTRAYYQGWLRPQLATGMGQITSLAARADYFISNLKMVLERGGRTLPGAMVTYDPPGRLEDLVRYGAGADEGRIRQLVAMNRRLVDPEGVWGERFHFTGFWEPGGSREPGPDLRAFVEGGAPPVVVTLGSMMTFDRRKLLADLAAALHLAGRRAVVVAGWSGLTGEEVTASAVHVVDEVSYDWLFPRAACVIHHGGCGTVAAVLRAGRPSVLLPQLTCQEQFGVILGRAGLAAGVLDAERMRPEDLAAAVLRATNDERYRQEARTWQEEVGRDEGVTGAARLAEGHWNGLTGRTPV